MLAANGIPLLADPAAEAAFGGPHEADDVYVPEPYAPQPGADLFTQYARLYVLTLV